VTSIFSKLKYIGVNRFLRVSRNRRDGSVPNVFRGLGENTCSLQPAFKNIAQGCMSSDQDRPTLIKFSGLIQMQCRFANLKNKK